MNCFKPQNGPEERAGGPSNIPAQTFGVFPTRTPSWHAQQSHYESDRGLGMCSLLQDFVPEA